MVHSAYYSSLSGCNLNSEYTILDDYPNILWYGDLVYRAIPKFFNIKPRLELTKIQIQLLRIDCS